MAKKDRINLINEFKQEQTNNDFIILTTYCFDPIFFDTYLLNKLQYNNPNSEIVILIDAEQYEKSYNIFTDITGKNYHLIPIYMKKVFHPKIFLFTSKLNNKLTLYVGSGNLTLPGLTKNAELISKTEYELNNEYSDITKILEFLRGLLEEFIKEKKVEDTINELIDYLLPFAGSEVINPKFRILHNLNDSIITQMINELDIDDFNELIMLAPFLSEKPAVIEILKDNLPSIERVSLILPEDNHNLKNVDKYLELASDRSINLEIKSGEFKEDSGRKFHSKILCLKGSQDYLLVGSPNLTISALLETSKNGNLECSIFYKGVNSEEILELIDSTPIVNLDKINLIEPIFDKYKLLKIFSADFNEDNKILTVETEPIDDLAEVIVVFEGKNKFKDYFNLKYGKISIRTSEGFPKEIIIKCSDKISRRRIFYDRNYFFRNLSRSGKISLNDLNKKSSDPSITQNELLTMLMGVVNIPREKEIKAGSAIASSLFRKRKRRIETPSQARNFLNSTLKDLTDIYTIRSVRRNIEENLEEYDEEKSIPTKEYKLYLRLSKKLTDKRIMDNINKINDLIKFRSEYCPKEDEKLCMNSNEKLILQSFLIELFLRFPKENINIEILENFCESLEENIIDINENELCKDSTIPLFRNLIIINYLYKFKNSYNFSDRVFTYNDFITAKNYFLIKDHVYGFLNLNYPDLLFNCKEFRDYYVGMVHFIFDSGTIEEGLINLIYQIKYEEGEFKSVLLKILKIILYGSDDYPKRFSTDGELSKEAKRLLLSNENSI